MELVFAAATDVGKQRNHNEDNFLVDKKLQLFIVADGMGGHAAGEVASSITVHQLRDAVHENRDLLERFAAGVDQIQAVEILQMLEHSVQAACGAVYDRAQAETEKRGMGTTVSVLLLVDGPETPRGFIAHVGDSRIYLVRQGQTHQLTEDHSLMNELIKRGKVKAGEIDNSPYKQFKNAVTRAVGVYASVEVDTFDFDILPGDQFLLCSDGLYAYFGEDELPGLLGEQSIADVPRRLIAQANAGGGHDNITAVVLRIPEEALEDADLRAADLSLKLEVLKGMPLFRYLSYKELVRVMNITETVAFPSAEEFIHEGDPGETMYVVLEGQIRLHKGDNTIAKLGRGQHFGEMALVDRSPRSLSATAEARTRLLAIRRKDFYEIIKKEPGLSVKLLWSFVQVLAERLRKTTADLDTARNPGQPPFAVAATPRSGATKVGVAPIGARATAGTAAKAMAASAAAAAARGPIDEPPPGSPARDASDKDDEPEISLYHDDEAAPVDPASASRPSAEPEGRKPAREQPDDDADDALEDLGAADTMPRITTLTDDGEP